MSLEKNISSKWYLETEKIPIGFLLSSKFSILCHDEAVSISKELINLDQLLLKSNVKEFDYWQSNFVCHEGDIGYIQMLNGRRIMDTRYIVSLVSGNRTEENMSKLLASVNNSASLYGKNHPMAAVSLERYKQIILNPKYNSQAQEISESALEETVDQAIKLHRKDPLVASVKRHAINKHKDVLVPYPNSINNGQPVELHKGIFISAGTQYLEGNPFEQFLYMTIDTEKGEVVKIVGSSPIKHATFIDGSGICSYDINKQLRKEQKISDLVIDV